MKKRLQKLFAVLLAFSMVMSLMSVTAFAEEGIATVGEDDLNPSYTVQYYANLPMLASSAAEATEAGAKNVQEILVLDTSDASITKTDGVVISNSPDQPEKLIYLNLNKGKFIIAEIPSHSRNELFHI